MIILGIDPGTSRVGIGVIKKHGSSLIHIESGLLPLRKKYINEGERLCVLEKELKKVLKRRKPDLVGIESLYFSNNQKTAFSVSQARGVILKTIAENKIPYIELAPSEIKLSIAGHGKAPKERVAHMVGILLQIDTKKIIDDITDALAIAIAACYIKKY